MLVSMDSYLRCRRSPAPCPLSPTSLTYATRLFSLLTFILPFLLLHPLPNSSFSYLPSSPSPSPLPFPRTIHPSYTLVGRVRSVKTGGFGRGGRAGPVGRLDRRWDGLGRLDDPFSSSSPPSLPSQSLFRLTSLIGQVFSPPTITDRSQTWIMVDFCLLLPFPFLPEAHYEADAKEARRSCKCFVYSGRG